MTDDAFGGWKAKDILILARQDCLFRGRIV